MVCWYRNILPTSCMRRRYFIFILATPMSPLNIHMSNIFMTIELLISENCCCVIIFYGVSLFTKSWQYMILIVQCIYVFFICSRFAFRYGLSIGYFYPHSYGYVRMCKFFYMCMGTCILVDRNWCGYDTNQWAYAVDISN